MLPAGPCSIVYTMKLRENWAVQRRWRTVSMAGSVSRSDQGRYRDRHVIRLNGRQNTANIEILMVVIIRRVISLLYRTLLMINRN